MSNKHGKNAILLTYSGKWTCRHNSVIFCFIVLVSKDYILS